MIKQKRIFTTKSPAAAGDSVVQFFWTSVMPRLYRSSRLKKDRLFNNPTLARNILIAGAVIHFLLCIPLYGRRGFPEPDPAWLSMIWLWIPAIPISAVFERFGRRRLKHLASYMLAAAFAVSWCIISAVPSYRTPVEAAIEAPLFFVLLAPFAALLEMVSQVIATCIRKFISVNRCEECGYCIRHLSEPRCPECGTPFDPVLLDPNCDPEETPFWRRHTTRLILAIVVVLLLWPFGYRHWTFESYKNSGRQSAENDWANGSAKWYVSDAEQEAMTDEQFERFNAAQNNEETMSGLMIERGWRDWQHETYETAYREVIERKLKEAGLPPPSFD